MSETSGSLSGHEKEPLPLDHFHMNKFEDPDDNNYQNVSEQIEKMVKAAQLSLDIGKQGKIAF